jgi:hypothetical protein
MPREEETQYFPETNDMSQQGLLVSQGKESYEAKPDSGLTAANPSSTSGTASAAIASLSSNITVFVVVALLIVGATAMSSSSLTSTIKTSDWLITYHSVSFSLSAPKSDNSYLASIALGDEEIQSHPVISGTQTIAFKDLKSATDYRVRVENDSGDELPSLLNVVVRTRDLPTFPNGRLIVSAAEINETDNRLNVTLSLDDPQGYLSDFRFELDDGRTRVGSSIDDCAVPLAIDLSQLSRGFLDMSLFGKSSYVAFGGEEIVLTRYGILY